MTIRVRRFQRIEKCNSTVLNSGKYIDKVIRTTREKETGGMEVFPEEVSLELGLQVCVGVYSGE